MLKKHDDLLHDSTPQDVVEVTTPLDKLLSEDDKFTFKQSIEQNVIDFDIKLSERGENDLNLQLFDSLETLHHIVYTLYRIWKGVKFFLYCKVELVKPSYTGDGEEQFTVAHLRSTVSSHHAVDEPSEELLHSVQEHSISLLAQLDSFSENGSGWILNRVLMLILGTVKYSPLSGGCSHHPTLPFVKGSNSCINIPHNGAECFRIGVLVSLFHKLCRNGSQKSAHYYEKRFGHLIDTSNLTFPVTINNIIKFEKLNTNIGVNVFTYDEKHNEFYPVRVTSKKDPTVQVCDLLLVKSHYISIVNKSRLFAKQVPSGKRRKLFCNFCLNHFKHQHTLDEHVELCGVHSPTRTIMPQGDYLQLTFNKIENTELIDFYICFDFEASLCPIPNERERDSPSWTIQRQRHVPNSFAYVVIDSYGDVFTPPVVYTGEDAADVLLDMLQMEAERILTLKAKKMTPLNPDESRRVFDAKFCEKCSAPFTAQLPKCADHCHYTGKFRMVLCLNCNFKIQMRKRVACLAHNLSSYDQNFIMQAIAKRFCTATDKLFVLPNTREKFKAFTYNQLQFLDSYSFLQGSLDKVVATLAPTDFKIFESHFVDSEQRDLLRNSKQCFCYEYIDSFEKLSETCLPPYEHFYSSLKGKNISREDYERTLLIYDKFNCKTILDFLQLYVCCDVLLLACCVQRFRVVNYSEYGIDCLRYISAPSFYFQCCLKVCDTPFELFDSIDKYLLIENGIRGGLSQVFSRQLVANNKGLSSYDDKKETSYGLLLDFNALYPSAQYAIKMPLNKFRWLTRAEIDALDVMSIDIEGDKGYIFYLDLHYPNDIKEYTKNFPLCPTNINITYDMLTEYQKKLIDSFHYKLPKKNVKLVATQLDKDNLVIHAAPLLVYLRLGMQIKRIHKVLAFHQSYWLRPWVEKTMALRQQSTSAFENQNYKLALNSVFGSFLLSKRKQRKVKLIGDKKRLQKYVSSPYFCGYTILSEKLTSVEYRPKRVYLDRPYILGFCTLEFARTIVYEYFYFKLKPIFRNRLQLAYTDTDSYCLHIVSENVYEELRQLSDTLDTSNYPKDHFLYSIKNKARLLCIKDECASRLISRGYFVKSKCYAIDIEGEPGKKKLKGLARNSLNSNIQLDDYQSCIENETRCIYARQINIQAKNFILYTVESRRMALNGFDDKNAYYSSTELTPHGYVSLQNDDGSSCG